MDDLLSDQLLHDVVAGVLAAELVSKKLAWWLASGYSIERWFQFELAFALNERLMPSYVTGCESKYVDISIYRNCDVPPGGIWTSDAVAEVELKVRGNWFTNDPGYIFGKLLEDEQKVSARGCPALALTLWCFAMPSWSNALLAWLGSQIREGQGVDTVEKLWSKLQQHKVQATKLGAALSVRVEGFDEFHVHVFAFRNGKTLSS